MEKTIVRIKDKIILFKKENLKRYNYYGILKTAF